MEVTEQIEVEAGTAPTPPRADGRGVRLEAHTPRGVWEWTACLDGADGVPRIFDTKTVRIVDARSVVSGINFTVAGHLPGSYRANRLRLLGEALPKGTG